MQKNLYFPVKWTSFLHVIYILFPHVQTPFFNNNFCEMIFFFVFSIFWCLLLLKLKSALTDA